MEESKIIKEQVLGGEIEKIEITTMRPVPPPLPPLKVIYTEAQIDAKIAKKQEELDTLKAHKAKFSK